MGMAGQDDWGLLSPQDLHSESPRSGRQHKAWGVSPRIALGKSSKPARRAAAESFERMLALRLSPASRVQCTSWHLTWGSRPRLYADVRSADSKQLDASSRLMPSQSLALGLSLIAAPQLGESSRLISLRSVSRGAAKALSPTA